VILLWTQRDLDIVETLTRRLRLLDTEQIERIWWPDGGSLRLVRRRLRRLVEAGLLATTIANVHPSLRPDRPLVAWQPGQEEPDFWQLSIAARARWSKPSVPKELYYTTRLAANLFGSSPVGDPHFTRRDRDLLLGEVYVFYRIQKPAEAAGWIGQQAWPNTAPRVKCPDVLLVNQRGGPMRAVQSAGRYRARQLDRFHRHCATSGLPYELW